MTHHSKSLLVAAFTAATSPAVAQDADIDLTGTWRSIACELRPQAGQDGVAPWYLTRMIQFAQGRIDAHFTTFADAACTTPLVELKFGGAVVDQGPSTVAAGARQIDLIIDDYLRVTPRLPGFAEFLASAETGTCGAENWAVGVEQDIFQTGCSVMGVAPNAPTTEFEVLHVSAGHLYFGARPVDGQPLAQPGNRPTALQMPLKRASGGMTQKVGADDLRVPRHVEIVLFEQAEGADPGEVRAFFETVTEKMNQNDTLLYRTVGQGADGTWLCVNYWTTRPDMETLNSQAQNWNDVFAAMAGLAKPESFRLSSYDTGL
ncbi:hypothetical protein [Primorskyibacter sp. S187A]|uniref:hypothetical protein n=1 Tax=Primorskyibacter sp. S187A TaxID=3415130 RepID=UPI003C799AA1